MSAVQFCLLAALLVTAPHMPMAMASWVAGFFIFVAFIAVLVDLIPRRKPLPPHPPEKT